MPAKDRYHDTVKRALIKDGWTIAREQAALKIGKRFLSVDIEAAKADPTIIILVEVKELDDVSSPVEALANALGKYILYRLILEESQIDVPLFMAVSKSSYENILTETLGQRVIQWAQIKLLVFDPEREEIFQWLP